MNKLKIYKVTRNDTPKWDQYLGFVCAAESPEEAAQMDPRDDGDLSESWVDPGETTVTLVGSAEEGVESGVIMTSFKAG